MERDSLTACALVSRVATPPRLIRDASAHSSASERAHRARDNHYASRVEILPGRGVPSIKLDADRADVRARLGAPTSERGDSAFCTDRDPGLVLRFAASGSLEPIEIPYSGNGHEVTLESS